MSDKSRDMWSVIININCRKSMMSNFIYGNYDNDHTVNVISCKYMSLYNSAPYNEDEMPKSRSINNIKVNACNTASIITVVDVTNAITHRITGKSDGRGGL